MQVAIKRCAGGVHCISTHSASGGSGDKLFPGPIRFQTTSIWSCACAGWLWGGHAEDMLVECISKCCCKAEPLNSRMVRFNGSLMLAGEFERHSGEICAFQLQQRLAAVQC